MKNLKLILTLILFFVNYEEIFSQNWVERLIPLQTKREEIEKILVAKPFNAKVVKESNPENRRIFHLKDGNLFVYFSLGRCVNGWFGRFELDKDIIIQASFKPDKWRKISYYEKDVKSLKKDSSSSILYYENKKKGISYEVQNGRVSEISFSGPENIDLIPCKDK